MTTHPPTHTDLVPQKPAARLKFFTRLKARIDRYPGLQAEAVRRFAVKHGRPTQRTRVSQVVRGLETSRPILEVVLQVLAEREAEARTSA